MFLVTKPSQFPKPMDELTLRVMLPTDIDAGLRLCRAAGWNQLSRDWELFLALNPEGCRVATLNNQIVGSVATVRYENHFSWIGMVLVDPATRGQGIGRRLLNEALSLLADMPCARLDATPAGHPLYQKLGFADEYELLRMEAPALNFTALPATSAVRPLSPEDWPAVFALDHAVFGAARQVTLEWMQTGAPELALVAEHNGAITGYAFGRNGFNFTHIGPVVAQSCELAQQLVSASLRANQTPYVLDVPRLHGSAWMQWLTDVGFREQRQLTRMFRGTHTHRGLPEKQFAILGPEFG